MTWLKKIWNAYQKPDHVFNYTYLIGIYHIAYYFYLAERCRQDKSVHRQPRQDWQFHESSIQVFQQELKTLPAHNWICSISKEQFPCKILVLALRRNISDVIIEDTFLTLIIYLIEKMIIFGEFIISYL